MKLCTCFQRNSAKIPSQSRYYSLRSLYLTGVLSSISGIGPSHLLKASLQCQMSINLTFLCATYSSLYLSSSLSLLRLCDLLFVLRAKILPTCVQLEKSYLLQSYNTHIFCNAYIFSSIFQEGLMQGLNLTHLIHLVSSKMRLLLPSFHRKSAPSKLGLILTGRIKGHIRNRWVAKMNALCVSSFTNRILDIGYKTSLSSLGLKAELFHLQRNISCKRRIYK